MIRQEQFSYTFSDTVKMEELFPGWAAQRFMENYTNPDWCHGDPVIPEDDFHPNIQAMIRYQVLRSGVLLENVVWDDYICATDRQGHASHHLARHGKQPHARDLYLIVGR